MQNWNRSPSSGDATSVAAVAARLRDGPLKQCIALHRQAAVLASETHTADAELARLAEILELTLAASEEFHSFHCELKSLVTSLTGALATERTH